MIRLDIAEALSGWLEGGGRRIGQISIRSGRDGSWELRHRDDEGREDLCLHSTAEAARHIANPDEARNYRPLKTAPTLARGWKLVLPDRVMMRRALDYFYPAMTGVWFRYEREEVVPIFLRETLGRQTGMYRVTQKVSDEQARDTIDSFCSGCLKQRLWEISARNPAPLRATPGEMPLICHEACNLLIAEIRKVVKSARTPEPAA